MQSGTAGTADGPALSAEAIAFAKTRGISRLTLECLGVASGTVFFPSLNRRASALFFRYGSDWKARALEAKAFRTNEGAKLGFWNLESVIQQSPETVFITEGELDACALVEAGVGAGSVLSVPNGTADARDGDG